jgi:DNA-binding MarR family transcriptional regulator
MGNSTRTDEYACARAWVALTAAHSRVSERLTAALAQSFGLSINDFEVLLRLDHSPPPGQRLGELIAAVPLTQPSLSRLVVRLEQRGWVSRTGDRGDRRGVLVAITGAGREVLRAAVPVHAKAIHETLLSRLAPDEQRLLAEALGRIVQD